MRMSSVSLFAGGAIVAACCISAAQHARADTIYSYQIPATTVLFGFGYEQFSGSFSWDATTSTISNINVTMTSITGGVAATFITALSDTTSTLIDLDTATADFGGTTSGLEFLIGVTSPGLSGGSTVSMDSLYYWEYFPPDASILNGSCPDCTGTFGGDGLGQNSPAIDLVGVSTGVSTTPVPSAVLLFVGGLGVFALMARFKRRNNAASLAAA